MGCFAEHGSLGTFIAPRLNTTHFAIYVKQCTHAYAHMRLGGGGVVNVPLAGLIVAVYAFIAVAS